jgi:hypothetical protein
MVESTRISGAAAMIEIFDGLTSWHWLGLATGMLGAHLLMPFGMAYTLGRGVLTLALTAGIVGLALGAAPDLTGWQQLGLAVLFAVPSAYGLNFWAERGHRRAAQCLDRIFTLTQAIVAGTGRIEIDGRSWPIQGNDLPAGAEVKVVDIVELVQVAELHRAGFAGAGGFETGASVKVTGLELALEVEKA